MSINTRPTEAKTGRQIGSWGTTSRLLLGGIFIYAAFNMMRLNLASGEWTRLSNGWDDAIIGLVAFPAAVFLVLVLRGPNAPPVRFYGARGYGLNFLIWAVAWALAPIPTALFGGMTQLLAAARGYAGCELFAVSNWLGRRDDQIACPVHSSIDAWEARAKSHRAPEAC